MRKLILAAIALGTLSACAASPALVPARDVADTQWEPESDDADGDGVEDEADCAPDDAQIFPGADEICNDGQDNNCDALIDGEDAACS